MSPRRRRLRRLRKLVFWTVTVMMASLFGGLWFAYMYVTDSDTIASVVRSESPHYLRQGYLELGRAQIRPMKGEVELTTVRLIQIIDGVPFVAARVPWIRMRHDVKELFEGKFDPKDIDVAQLTLRLCRRKDGSWNLQGLLAGRPLFDPPPIHVRNATVELSDMSRPEAGVAILRDLTLDIKTVSKGKLSFEGGAKGDSFERVDVTGTVEMATGRVELKGDLERLTIAQPLLERIPPDLRASAKGVGLTGGEVDLNVARLSIDPSRSPSVRYDLSGRIREGVWHCPKMPFPLNDVRARFSARDGVVGFEEASGVYGTTKVRVDRARMTPGDVENAPLDVKLAIADLDLNDALRDWTPAQFAPLWRQYSPSGRVDVQVEATRAKKGGPLRHKMTVTCLDVAVLYEHFKYPLEHVRGRFVWDGDRVDVPHMETVVAGGGELRAQGFILRPGPDAEVNLKFEGDAMPIDKTLLNALPPDVIKVVKEFNPTGSVRGKVSLRRTPRERLDEDPMGKVAVDADLDLNERCGVVWDHLPYPVNNLTGHLEIHPDLWKFTDMKGSNGQAVITGSGVVWKEPGPKGPLSVDLKLKADRLPFDDQLRTALPPAWKKSWAVLNPTGSSDVGATITIRPGQKDDYKLTLLPGPATAVRLQYSREPKPGIDPGGTFELRMEDVSGRFFFHNGPVDMSNVAFRFHGSGVKFATGQVQVQDSGQFQIGVNDLGVKDIRLDPSLQQIMPPVMQQFAQRLDDGRAFTLRGNLGLGWSGKPGESVWCAWDGAKVIFMDNSVRTTSGMMLEHIQGELDQVKGRADGSSFEVHGTLKLDSVSMLGQQITNLVSPIDVERGVARLDPIRGKLLGGEVAGKLSVGLAATPRYETALKVEGADLRHYAKTVPGRQTFRGKVNAELKLEGLGGDVRTIQGAGHAQLFEGDLGQLPVYLQVFKILTLAPATKTAFDSAEIKLTVEDGKTYFNPIIFTGDAFSLRGPGTMDVQGDLDLSLRVLYGRDRVKVGMLNDVLREASGQILVIRVQGTPWAPKPKLAVVPEFSDYFKSAMAPRRERPISAPVIIGPPAVSAGPTRRPLQ